VVRNRIEIIAQILEVVNDGSGDGNGGGDDGVPKTKIMYKAFLNYAQLKEYLTFLTDNGLLSYDLGTQTFKTTQKALRFLKAYGQLDQLTKE
jgi:predicted transcriptional regulator